MKRGNETNALKQGGKDGKEVYFEAETDCLKLNVAKHRKKKMKDRKRGRHIRRRDRMSEVKNVTEKKARKGEELV